MRQRKTIQQRREEILEEIRQCKGYLDCLSDRVASPNGKFRNRSGSLWWWVKYQTKRIESLLRGLKAAEAYQRRAERVEVPR